MKSGKKHYNGCSSFPMHEGWQVERLSGDYIIDYCLLIIAFKQAIFIEQSPRIGSRAYYFIYSLIF